MVAELANRHGGGAAQVPGWMASTLLHEALHIHFVLSHRTVTMGRPSVNNMYCYDTLVARFHGRMPKPGDEDGCRNWQPRR